VLVLGAGGTVGEAWLNALLAGIEEAAGIDFRRAECFVGTSAGSIVAARLCAGRRPRRPRELPGGASAAVVDGGPRDDVWTALASAAAPVVGPLVPLALAASAPGSALARRLLLAVAPRGTRTHDGLAEYVNADRARFDGRLRVCCVDRSSGRRVVFGAPGAPDSSVGEAVIASCSIPGVFAPVRIGDREYVDGGAWSPTNIDAAVVAGGTRVLCLNPLGSIGADGLSARTLLAGGIRLAETVEALALRARGASVQTIAPDAACTAAMGTDLMAARARPAVARAGYEQGLAVGRLAAA
jgi:NTE family protein